MSVQSTQRSSVCPDCGGPKYRYARFCKPCSSKGERNANFGKKAKATTREKIRQSALARERKPRSPKVPSTTAQAGREFARRWLELPDLCERCRTVPPRDRHHVDGNTLNNDPANIQFLCRRCHQETDGRIEMLRRMGRAKGEVTHCKHGHPYDEQNTYWTTKGSRSCRKCQQAADVRYRAKQVREGS